MISTIYVDYLQVHIQHHTISYASTIDGMMFLARVQAPSWSRAQVEVSGEDFSALAHGSGPLGWDELGHFRKSAEQSDFCFLINYSYLLLEQHSY